MFVSLPTGIRKSPYVLFGAYNCTIMHATFLLIFIHARKLRFTLHSVNLNPSPRRRCS